MKVSGQEAFASMTTDDLFTAYSQTHQPEIKWEIALRYTDLIKGIALQVRGIYCSFTQLDDIIDEGLIVLADAVDKYDPERGQFDTYVSKRIRGMIIDLARQQDWVPRTVRRRAQQIERAMTDIYSDTGRFPTDAEVASHLEISIGDYQEALANSSMHSFLSLEELFEGAEQYPVSTANSNALGAAPEQTLQNEELVAILAGAISSLKENEQLVLSLYYQNDLKMKDIADVLGVSAPRVSQIHAKALQKLKILVSQYVNE